MANAVRQPTKKHASRAGSDMHSKNAQTRREAAEVLSLLARKSTRSKGK